MKITAALRILAYASSADSLDENFEMAESTILESLKRFCEAVTSLYSENYLRAPTDSDIKRLLKINAQRGFMGMLGSIDCMHWQWKNCPVALAGQYKGKEKKPTVVLEAWADQELWIWHCNFGSPGSLNDINILDQSPVFQKILQGVAPSVKFRINGSVLKNFITLSPMIIQTQEMNTTWLTFWQMTFTRIGQFLSNQWKDHRD